MYNWRRADDSARSRSTQNEAPLPGVIDTVGLGYAALWLRPQVVLPPILLDFYLWLGPQVTARPLTLRAADWLRDLGVGETLADTVEGRHNFNVFELLSMQLGSLNMPTIIPEVNGNRLDALRWLGAVEGLHWGIVALLLVVSLVIGFIVGGAFLVAMAAATTGTGRIRDMFEPAVAGRVAMVLVAGLFAFAGLFLLVAGPIIAAEVAVAATGFGAPGLLSLLLLLPLAWGFVYFFFAPEAVVVDRIGAFASLRASYRVVKGYFWQSIRFIFLSMIVTTGFPFALRVFTENEAGLIVFIVGNAFVASGMIAAAMLFYRDRARRLGLPAYTPTPAPAQAQFPTPER